MKKLIWIFILLFFVASKSFSSEDFYLFRSTEDQQRFQALTTELRCLVCQNQNLAESNAALAADLRDKIFDQITTGKSDKEIIQYLVARYGNFILYQPPMNKLTLMLWFGPLLILISGLGYLIFYLRKHLATN